MNDEKKRTELKESKEEFEKHFMSALFETFRHQYGECTIEEITTEDKTA